MQVMSLAPMEDANYIAVQNGDWSSPATWGGEIPTDNAKVLIPIGMEVVVDKIFTERLFTVRVDGSLTFSPINNTQLLVESLFVMPDGLLEIGNANTPINENVTAKILILDNGDINFSYDPTLLSRGVVTLGKTVMHGHEKSSFVKAGQWIPAGSTNITLEEAPTNWNAGDRIVLSGLFTEEQEEFTIAAINGSQLTLNKPTENNRTITSSSSLFDGLYTYVANYTRNIIIESENKTDIPRRGHLMFMHQQDVDIRYVQLEELGRTNKAIELDPVLTSSNSNSVGRYALHFHRAGDTDKNGQSGYVKGCALWGSPGWGYVNHESNAWFEENASYNVFGSHFTDENGSELGGFRGNIAIFSEGSNDAAGSYSEKKRENGDHGHTGVGFWATTGATVRWENNVATDQNMSGYAIISRKAPDDLHLYDFNNHDDPASGAGIKETNAKLVGINFFRNNVNHGGRFGIVVVDLELNGRYNTNNVFEDFTILNTTGFAGFEISYMRNLHLKNVKILRDDILSVGQWRGKYACSFHSTYDHLFRLKTKGWTYIDNVTTYGFLHAFDVIRSNEGDLREDQDNKVYVFNNNNLNYESDEIADNSDADHFRDDVNFEDIPNRPTYSVTPGVHNEPINVTINSDPGTTVYYTIARNPNWSAEYDAMMDLNFTEELKYNGETLEIDDSKTVIFSIAVKEDGLQSRVSAAYYYVEDGETTEVIAASDVEITTAGPVQLDTNNDVLLQHLVYPSNATNQNVTWTTNNSNIAAVSSSGVVTGVSAGTATITVTTEDGGYTDQIQIEVLSSDISVGVEGITLNPESLTLQIEETSTLTASIFPTNAGNKSITWSSNSPGIATVNNQGVVTAIAPGDAEITVTTNDGNYTARTTVTVNADVEEVIHTTGIEITTSSPVQLHINDNIELNYSIQPSNATNQNVEWETDNPDIATISANGTVTGVSEGVTTITIHTEDGNFSDQIQIEVLNASVSIGVTSILVNPETLTLETSETSTLTATIFPFNAEDKSVIWSSNNPEIVMVNSEGAVTAMAPGEAEITVTSNDGNFTAQTHITVYAEGDGTPEDPNSVDPEGEISDLIIYPNPASHTLYIKGLSDVANVSITSLDGKIVQFETKFQEEDPIDISNLSAGLYVLTITYAVENKESKNLKFVVY